MIDAYIKRFKSASFAALIALLVGMSLVTSRSGLLNAYEQSREWLLVSIVLGAELGGGSAIESIGGIDESEWRRQHPDLPRFGKVLDVVRNLTATEAIEGRIVAAGGRMIQFQSTPVQLTEPACQSSSSLPTDYCSRYRFEETKFLADEVHFLYTAPAGGEAQWLARRSPRTRPMDAAGAEDQVLRIAEPWVGENSSALSAFDALADKLRSQTIKLPVLNVDLPARLATLSLALFALVTAYVVASSLAGIERGYDPSAQKEPWIAQRAISYAGGWSALIQRSLPWISRSASYAQVFLPTFVLLVALALSPSGNGLVAVGACAVPALFLMLYSAKVLTRLLRQME